MLREFTILRCLSRSLAKTCQNVPQRRGAPRGRPVFGPADGEGRHEACPYVAIEFVDRAAYFRHSLSTRNSMVAGKPVPCQG